MNMLQHGATGQLEQRVLISEPLGQQTGTATQVDPDIVRVVEQNAVTAAVDEVSPAVVTITPRGRDGSFVFESVGSGVIYDPDGVDSSEGKRPLQTRQYYARR